MLELSPKTFKTIAWSMILLAVLVYTNNVIVLPSLRAPDGFGHFTYIWWFAATGAVPLATSGWSFFHPPLYYAFMASVWHLLSSIDPVIRLKIGTGIIASLGIAQAGVAYLIVRRSVPDNRLAQLLAIGIILFLPLQIFSAGYLGNERLNAVFCGTSILMLMWLMDRPGLVRAAAFGTLLGLAMLVKFTAVVVVSGSFATLFFSFLFRRDYLQGFKVLLVVGVTMLSICGWFYVRNIERYGTPFQLSRETEMVQRVENLQTKGKRNLLEYVLFDPMIIASPQWPRGIPIYGRLSPRVVRSSLRESVWTGVFTNAWFDGIGGQVIPVIRNSPGAKHSGQVILALALVPTLMVLVGIGVTIKKLWREGWDDLHGAMMIIFLAMMAVFVYGTKMVVLHAAIKATYLTPVAVIFAFFLANGFDAVSKFHRGLARGALAACIAVAGMSVAVFSLGVIVGRGYLTNSLAERSWQNIYGIIQYAGGRKARALEMFEASARERWYLGLENFAAVALENERPQLAVRKFLAAARMQPKQSFGLPADRLRFNNASQAEYSNQLAVAYFRSGESASALRSARDSVGRDRKIPEADYNLGMLLLMHSLSLADDGANAKAYVENARDHFQTAWELDPAFREAMAMNAVAKALLADCDGARDSFEQADAVAPHTLRLFPFETGTGDMHTAGIHRRLRIIDVPEPLRPDFQRRACATAPRS